MLFLHSPGGNGRYTNPYARSYKGALIIIRVGVPAITTRGMKEDHMQIIVDLIDKVLMNIDDENIIAAVKEKVKTFMNQFPLYPELK